MRKYPALTFKLNKALDKEVCFNFLGVKAGGIDFGRGLVTLHPSLNKLDTLDKEGKIHFIRDYVNRYYRRKGHILAKFAKTFALEWRSVEVQYYRAVDQIFSNYLWPEGLYICYLSIFYSNPRFLENKTFQMYCWNPDGVKYIVAHEMLHFIFYDYVERKFTEEIKHLPPQKIWVLSEVFNNIILSLPEFMKFTEKTPLFYPDHVELTEKLRAIWKRLEDTDLFLKRCLELA